MYMNFVCMQVFYSGITIIVELLNFLLLILGIFKWFYFVIRDNDMN